MNYLFRNRLKKYEQKNGQRLRNNAVENYENTKNHSEFQNEPKIKGDINVYLC